MKYSLNNATGNIFSNSQKKTFCVYALNVYIKVNKYTAYLNMYNTIGICINRFVIVHAITFSKTYIINCCRPNPVNIVHVWWSTYAYLYTYKQAHGNIEIIISNEYVNFIFKCVFVCVLIVVKMQVKYGILHM